MTHLGGDTLHRGDDENCTSADDFAAAAVTGSVFESETFNQTHTTY